MQYDECNQRFGAGYGNTRAANQCIGNAVNTLPGRIDNTERNELYNRRSIALVF
jgi:hypothetical protein